MQNIEIVEIAQTPPPQSSPVTTLPPLSPGSQTAHPLADGRNVGPGKPVGLLGQEHQVDLSGDRRLAQVGLGARGMAWILANDFGSRDWK